jgi:6-pyruvoyltetrahydropterin/6-carboxytetrahydropterin synthase
MHEQFHIRIAGDRLIFSAGHFITLGPGLCEALHGHDYRVAVEIAGPLDANHYVVDYTAVQEIMAAILAELDHRVLLPTQHPAIRVETQGEEIHVRYDDRRWVLPACDCRLLPVPNTTTELLARHIAGRLDGELSRRLQVRSDRVRVEITEGASQGAVCELRKDDCG